jgi:hypothetical protein
MYCVSVQKSGYDQFFSAVDCWAGYDHFLPVIDCWGTKHLIPDMISQLLTEEERLST